MKIEVTLFDGRKIIVDLEQKSSFEFNDWNDYNPENIDLGKIQN